MTLSVTNATANVTESAISRTVSAGSTVIQGVMDWNATNPPGKTPATGSGTATERRDAGDGTSFAQWAAEWANVSAGTFSFGPNNYTSLKVAQAICEVTSSTGTTSVSQYAQVSNWFASAAGSITGVSWVTGDAIIVISGCENNSGTSPPTPTNANLTFSSNASSVSGADQECGVNLRSAIAGSTQSSQTISLTDPGTESGGAGCWVIHEEAGGTNAPAGNAAATGAAGAATTKISPSAGNAAATGAASSATVKIAASAGNAAATGAAAAASVKVAPVVSAAAATGAAFNATVTTGGATTNAAAGNAAATGAAGDATTKVSPSAGNAAATGAAHNATVSTSGATNAPAGNAAATGAAGDATIKVAPVVGHASVTGQAFNATVVTGSFTNAAAGNAAATGAANNATVKIAPVVTAATATGQAFNPTVTTGSTTNALAGVATAIAAAGAATIKIALQAGHASATGTAFDAGTLNADVVDFSAGRTYRVRAERGYLVPYENRVYLVRPAPRALEVV